MPGKPGDHAKIFGARGYNLWDEEGALKWRPEVYTPVGHLHSFQFNHSAEPVAKAPGSFERTFSALVCRP